MEDDDDDDGRPSVPFTPEDEIDSSAPDTNDVFAAYLADVGAAGGEANDRYHSVHSSTMYTKK